MPALDQAVAEMLLNGLAGLSAYTATTTPLKLRITMNAPTATVAGTEISGTGYTPGGSTITFSAPTGTPAGALMLSSNSIAWTNGSSSAWNAVGAEIWDSTGTPRRLWWGLLDDQPLTIGPGSPLSLAAAAVAVAFP